jgi:hypothetical protein
VSDVTWLQCYQLGGQSPPALPGEELWVGEETLFESWILDCPRPWGWMGRPGAMAPGPEI